MTEASKQVLSVLRQTDNMQWYVVPLFVFVVYVYVVEGKKKNWSAVLLGLAFWGAEFIWEMFNALVLHFSGYAALWMTPGRSALVIYAGLNIEIALFFATAGVLVIKSLPVDRQVKILGISNRLFLPIAWGLLAVLVEVLLNRAGLLVWEYRWWGWPHLWLVVVAYCVPWLAITWCHDHWTLKRKKKAALLLPVAALGCHLVLATALGWI